MSRKITAWIHTLTPFIEISKDYSQLEISDTSLGNTMLDVLQYSLLTTNDALSIYSNTISDMISKDRDIIKTMEEDASILKNSIYEKLIP